MAGIVAVGIDCKKLGSSMHHIHKMSIAFEVFHNHRTGLKSMGNHIEFGACWHNHIVGPESEEQHNCIEIGFVVGSKSFEQQSNIDVWHDSPPLSHFLCVVLPFLSPLLFL